MSDGTRLNLGTTGDLIVTEEITTAEPGRLANNLPSGTYKMPRSKIAVGSAGYDEGNATAETPLEVTSRRERHIAEQASIAQLNAMSLAGMQRSSRERVTLLDRRGSSGERGRR